MRGIADSAARLGTKQSENAGAAPAVGVSNVSSLHTGLSSGMGEILVRQVWSLDVTMHTRTRPRSALRSRPGKVVRASARVPAVKVGSIARTTSLALRFGAMLR